MTRFDRYLCRCFLGPFVVSIVTLTAILMGSVFLLPLMHEAGDNQFSLWHSLLLLGLKLPFILSLVLPMSTLLGMSLAFSQLSRQLALLTCVTSGVRFSRFIIPVCVIGMVLSGVHLGLSEWAIPLATQQSAQIRGRYKGNQKKQIDAPIDVVIYDSNQYPKMMLNAIQSQPDTLTKVGVVLYQNHQISAIYDAPSAVRVTDHEWRLEGGRQHQFLYQPEVVIKTRSLDHVTVTIPVAPAVIVDGEKDPDKLNATQLKAYINNQSKLGMDTRFEQMKYQFKFAVPFANVLLAFCGACIGFRPYQRVLTQMNMGISLVIILIYFLLTSIALSLATVMPVVVAAWVPNTVIMLGCLVYFRRLFRE